MTRLAEDHALLNGSYALMKVSYECMDDRNMTGESKIYRRKYK